jgi:hypothetical protein
MSGWQETEARQGLLFGERPAAMAPEPARAPGRGARTQDARNERDRARAAGPRQAKGQVVSAAVLFGLELPRRRRRMRQVPTRDCERCCEQVGCTGLCAGCHFRGWWGRWA